MKLSKLLLTASALGAGTLAFTPAAFAQDAEPAADAASEELVIVVSAQKRDQNWLDVPAAISVQSAEDLKQERSTTTYDILRQVPGVTGSNPSQELTQVAIRGVSSEDYGIGSDPTVGVFFDGVYLGRAENTTVRFIDLERAEIIRGPQGALFGRATPAGAISLVPVRPGPDSEISGLAEIGTEGFFRASAIGNVALSDSTFLRGSVLFDRRGDFVDNLTLDESLGEEQSITARLALRHEFSSMTTLDITGWYESFEGDPWLYRNFVETTDDGPVFAGRFDFTDEIFSDVSAADLEESRQNWGVSARIEQELDSGTKLVSITSALGYNADYLEDFDGSDWFLFNYGQYGEQSLLSQEFRVVSGDSGPFTWFAGVLAYKEDVKVDLIQSYGDFDLCVFYEFDDEVGCAPAGDGVTDTFIFADGNNKGFALYGEGSYELTDRLSFTAGLRYTRDTKELTINAPTPGGFLPADDVGYTNPTDGLDVLRRETFTSWQPRFAVNFRASDAASFYAIYSEGEKPGGFDTFDAFSPSFNAEKVETFEGGLKGSAVNGRVTYSLAAYTTDYTDLQVLVADGPRDIVQNAAAAGAKGVEAEAGWKQKGFEASVRGALIDAEFEDFVDGDVVFSGNRLPYTPKYSVGATLGLSTDVSDSWNAYGRVDADYQGRQFLTPANNPFASNPSYERIDLRFGIKNNDGLEVYAFGQNVTGVDYVAYGDVTDYDQNYGAYLAQFSRPAVFGIGLTIGN